jgi:anti-sigma-K factor RskA
MTIRQNVRQNATLREMLAAEYTLGTLKGGARRRLESWLADDAALRFAISEWQDRLNPMSEFATPEQPSPEVWRAISKQIGLKKAEQRSRKSFWLGLREDLNFWRGLGMTSTALATVLIAVLLTRQPEVTAPQAPMFVATLTNEQAQPIALVTGDAHNHKMVIKVLTRQAVAEDKSLELWAVPKDGAPRSLGLIAADGTVTLPMPAGSTPDSIPLLAVTLEPKGGSPNPNGPTGPIVFKGAWLHI